MIVFSYLPSPNTSLILLFTVTFVRLVFVNRCAECNIRCYKAKAHFHDSHGMLQSTSFVSIHFDEMRLDEAPFLVCMDNRLLFTKPHTELALL